MQLRLTIFSVMLVLTGSITHADDLLVAVASNFQTTARTLADEYEKTTGHRVRISAASTGKLYAQIINGAPYHLFLAADSERPERLEAESRASNRFTYARGSLTLWSRAPEFENEDCREMLGSDALRFLAIANPQTAPYGRAAKETLQSLGMWETVKSKLVTGENISQALQYVASGSANLGFVASAQLLNQSLPESSCSWQVPGSLHQPINQQAVLLARGEGNPAARGFLEFLHSKRARELIRQSGYHSPL